MGTWGTGIYDNDDAADWSFEVAETGLSVVESALDAALESEYVEAPVGVYGLAAADVVARLVSNRGEDSPYCEGIVAWVAANPITPSPSLVAKARLAVQRVRGENSELRELWSDDAESLAEWLATIADIEQRLSA